MKQFQIRRHKHDAIKIAEFQKMYLIFHTKNQKSSSVYKYYNENVLKLYYAALNITFEKRFTQFAHLYSLTG